MFILCCCNVIFCSVLEINDVVLYCIALDVHSLVIASQSRQSETE